MRAFAVWMRRGTARYTAPVIVGIVLYGLVSRGGWRYEWVEGFRTPLWTMILVSPLVAATAAFDASRMWGGLVEDDGRQTPRLLRFLGAALATTVLWPFGAFCLAWAAAAARLWQAGALGHPDPWLAFEVLAGLSGSAAVGMAIGTRVRGVAAAPLAAVTVYLVLLLATGYNLLSLLSALGTSGSLLGLERSVPLATLAIVLNLSVAGTAWLVAVRPPHRSWSWTALTVVASVATLAVLAGTRQVARTTGEFVPTGSTTVCSGQAVRFCGPAEAAPYLREVAAALAAGAERLSGSGLAFATRYALAVPGTIPDTSPGAVATVELPPVAFYRDQDAAVSAVLAHSRTCPQLYNPDDATTQILDDQADVAAWIRTALTTGRSEVAPPAVRAAFETVDTCAGTR